MRTPAGKECPFYFEDYHRGREKQACRLIERNPDAGDVKWRPKHCTNCPVPGIVRANGCQHLVLEAKIESRWLGFVEGVKVVAACTKTRRDVAEPHIGCGECHADLGSVWQEALK